MLYQIDLRVYSNVVGNLFSYRNAYPDLVFAQGFDTIIRALQRAFFAPGMAFSEPRGEG
jgi:hypothetical protein